ncbi:MAG: cytochrome c [Betaproteobacteria bacterium]|nr:cytochrome c [Betaproteobacteria bacterium]
MKLVKLGAIAVPLLIAGAIAVAQTGPSSRSSGGCGGMMGGRGGMMGGWQRGPDWRGPGPMPRHHVAMMWGIPAPYTSMTNPLPRTQATLERGAAVYTANCAACHGTEGLGDGPAGRNPSPPPGNLAWLSNMPMSRWDAFMYWTIAEGGSQFDTAMPAFKDSLSKDQIWEVSAYVQAHLPPKSK